LIIFLLLNLVSLHNKAHSSSSQNKIDDYGLISIMYHRFDEAKYPSTNIQLEVFKEQLKIIEKEKIIFIHPNKIKENLTSYKKQRKILLTIDDGLSSFYENAWPILKAKKIPFLLFVSTREVGRFNYMSWKQIEELSKNKNVVIGNHSHSHEYLVNEKPNIIKKDILKSIEIFKNELGISSEFFSYPFGEYSLEFKKIIEELGFKFAFGQHSGVIDETKDLFELPRFPINEKYGEIKRFKTLMKTLPLKYNRISPENKFLKDSDNPPIVKIEFQEGIADLNLINCFSNEGNKWRNSNISFIKKDTLEIKISEKFLGERGRINCSLRDKSGFWRWLGIQFVLAE
tara:strand:+ start:3929 stop:4957 length:1029 start_codon:yes stop_codon:yes gene_type:complete